MNIRMFTLMAAFLFTILFQYCNHSTAPTLDKDPREYTWTIDTLYYPGSLQTMLKSIWGSSPNNIYAVGHSDELQGQIWHFDGKQWTSIYIFMGFAYTPYAIFGFSPNDIWVAGERIYDNYNPPPNFIDSSFIMHYDGSSWKRVPAYGGRIIETIWGRASNDIWFGGINGTLFHWNGTSIRRDTLPISLQLNENYFYNFPAIFGFTSGETYFLISASLSQIQMYLLKHQQNNWSVVDSNLWGYYRRGIWVSEKGNIYETGGGGFFKWNGRNWEDILGQFNGITVPLAAKSEDNMFIAGWSYPEPGKVTGLVYHYNGKDFYSFDNLKLADVTLLGAWWNGTDIFIVGYTQKYPQKTIILHGN